jgi:hypothetical protein
MPSLKLRIKETFPSHSSRPNGKGAREAVTELLDKHEFMTLDFEATVMTPSFADELIGGLASRLGFDEFHRRISLVGMNEDTEELVKHVVKRRSREREVA